MKTNCLIILAAAVAACGGVLPLQSWNSTGKDSLVSQAETAPATLTAGCSSSAKPDRSERIVRVSYLQGENDPRRPRDMTSDSLITGAIMREIIQERLAGATRNVRVTTRDGFVTLRGTVSAEFISRRVGVIAAGVVSWNNVDNRIIVVSSGSEG